jgi:hypothetical protein
MLTPARKAAVPARLQARLANAIILRVRIFTGGKAIGNDACRRPLATTSRIRATRGERWPLEPYRMIEFGFSSAMPICWYASWAITPIPTGSRRAKVKPCSRRTFDGGDDGPGARPFSSYVRNDGFARRCAADRPGTEGGAWGWRAPTRVTAKPIGPPNLAERDHRAERNHCVALRCSSIRMTRSPATRREPASW